MYSKRSFRFSEYILYVVLTTPVHATCLTHVILLDLIILTISGKEHMLWSFSLDLFSFLYPPKNTFG